MTASADEHYRDMAYVALHFGWSHDELLDLPRITRGRFVHEIKSLVDGV